MSTISNGSPQGFRIPGRESAVPRSLRDAEDVARSFGYDGIDYVPVGREFRAISYNARGYRAEAIGRTRELAAQSLVRVLARR
jgi:hypothetical protein